MPGLFILAEGGGSGGNAPMVILVGALAAFAIAYFVVGPGRRKQGPQRLGDIPLSMRPYHSDEELETTGMERAMAWGVALAVFASLFLPLYWLIEPSRINQRVEEFYEHDTRAGQALFAEACASCHGEDLGGGSAPHPNSDIEAPWPAPSLNDIVLRYQDSEIVDDVAEFMYMTMEKGRAGTPMPAFGVGEGGQYSDQQLQSIRAYILSVQGEGAAEEGEGGAEAEAEEAQAFEGASGEDIFAANCARCHGPDAEGYVGPQLQNVFERYDWEPGDEASLEQARAVVRDTIMTGRLVPGKAPMPSFSQALSDDAIEAVIDHLESIQETGGPRFGQIGGEPTAAEGDDE